MTEIRGKLDGTGQRLALVVSRYNETVTKGLASAALETLAELGVADADVTLVHVPGALELPVAARALARSGDVDAVIVLGAVIRGETSHYEHVCAETTRGCGEVALATGIPVLFGGLTCETLAQARDRSTTPAKNKGVEAARSAVEMIHVLATLATGARASEPSA